MNSDSTSQETATLSPISYRVFPEAMDASIAAAHEIADLIRGAVGAVGSTAEPWNQKVGYGKHPTIACGGRLRSSPIPTPVLAAVRFWD